MNPGSNLSGFVVSKKRKQATNHLLPSRNCRNVELVENYLIIKLFLFNQGTFCTSIIDYINYYAITNIMVMFLLFDRDVSYINFYAITNLAVVFYYGGGGVSYINFYAITNSHIDYIFNVTVFLI